MVDHGSSEPPPTRFLRKTRWLWQPSALRLIREKGCVAYAREAVPRVVDGFAIQFPDTQVALGLRVMVRSRHLEGRDLTSLLYQEATRDLGLDVGMATLKAFNTADISSRRFTLASLLYRWVRGPKVALREMLGSALLSRAQRQELVRLVTGHITHWSGKQVLVHGDLHAAHVLVDLERRSLGFIDLEAMHIGKATTNFAQLWGGFYYADETLAGRFYQRYREHFPGLLDAQFDTDVRLELALRSYSHIRAGRRQGNRMLEAKARRLLVNALGGACFNEFGGDEDA